MGLDKVTERLNAPRLFITNFGFPAATSSSLETPTPHDGDEDIIVPHATEKVHVQVSSEFSSVPRQLNLFGNAGLSEKESRRKLSLIHDLSGQPMIFSVSNTGELYCLSFVNGAGAGWQAFVVTPPCDSVNAVVDAFDTLERDNKIHLVVSMECQSPDQPEAMRQELWYATFEKPSLSVEQDSYNVSGISNDFLEWKQFATALSDRDVTSVLCCPSVKSRFGFHALVGTAARGKYAATYYIVDPAATENAWKPLVMSGSPEELLCMQPIVLGTGKYRDIGVVSAYRQTGGNKQQVCSAEIFDEESLEREFSHALQTGKLGSVNDIYSSLNPKGSTDLIVAGSKGIGFFDSYAISELVDTTPILPHISFKQVVCSENRKDDGTGSSILALFAISEQDELYFIQGFRNKNGDVPTFQMSGLPIRTGVAVMSPQYNPQTNACEILYVTNEINSGLRHLIRDPISSLWADGAVEFRPPFGKPAVLAKQAAYLTNIALSDSTGKGVPANYPVTITASPAVHVTCNGRSLLLNHTPRTVLANEQGHIDLALPPDAGMSCSQLQLKLIQFPPDNGVVPTANIEINPAQRVVNIMNTLKDKEAMQQAMGPDGEQVFDNDSMDNVEPLVTRFGDMTKHISSNRVKDEDEKRAEAREEEERDKEADRRAREDYEKEEARKRDQESRYRQSLVRMERNDAGNWFEIAVNAMEEVIEDVNHMVGDFIECVKESVAQVTALALEFAGPLLVMIIRVAGKAFSVEISGICPLLGTIFGVLKDILKNTFPKLYAYLQLLFDGELTIRAQKVFHRLVTSTMDYAENFIEASKNYISEWANDFQNELKEFIPDSRGQASDPSADQFLARASSLMNNPIVKTLLDLNPVSWIMDGIERGVAGSINLQEIKMPSPGKKFDLAATILGGVDSTIFSQVFNTVLSTFSSLISNGVGANPGNVKDVLLNGFGNLFHTLIDIAKSALNGLLGALGGLISSMKDFLTGEWNIPGLTDVWKDLTGLDFTILNFFTYILAFIWKAIALLPSLIFGDSQSNPMDTDHLLEKMEEMSLPLKPSSQVHSIEHTVFMEGSHDCEVLTMHTFYQQKSSLSPSDKRAITYLKAAGRITRSIATFLEIKSMNIDKRLTNQVHHHNGHGAPAAPAQNGAEMDQDETSRLKGDIEMTSRGERDPRKYGGKSGGKPVKIESHSGDLDDGGDPEEPYVNRRGAVLVSEQEQRTIDAEWKKAWDESFHTRMKVGIIGLNFVSATCGVAVLNFSGNALSKMSRGLQIGSLTAHFLGTVCSLAAFIVPKMGNQLRKDATAAGSIFQCIGSVLNWASELDEEWEEKSNFRKSFYIVDIISAGSGLVASVLAACGPINQATITLIRVDLVGSVVSGVGTFVVDILGLD